MPVLPMQELLRDAARRGYAVAAFNVFNDLSLDAVLAAAAKARSPVIVQLSVKTVKQRSAKWWRVLFEETAARHTVPCTLHLDHCPDRALIEECVRAGWNSVLFDASALSYEENLRQTREVVAFARPFGAAVEGELEAIRGVEDGHGSEEEGGVVALADAVRFLRETGVDSFAPAIGTAHGLYKQTPKVNVARVGEIVEATGIPVVVHGGTGLTEETFRALIQKGAVKINVSTQLKLTFLEAARLYLESNPQAGDPLALFRAVHGALEAAAARFLRQFGSEGMAA